MSTRRGEIEQSLAIRGRPVLWANEQEAAALSGVGYDRFRRRIKEWEERGFPKANLENGKRSIPAILAFWAVPQNSFDAGATAEAHPQDNDDGEENWGAAGKGQRWAT